MSELRDHYWNFVHMKQGYTGAGYLEVRSDWRERLPREVPMAGRVLKQALQGAGNVLDVGAGRGRLYKDVLAKLGVTASYMSADTDLDTPHDYRDFLAVQDRFDAILMLELIEHLPVETGLEFMSHAQKLLNTSGVLILSTPNAHHPNQIWRSELTHIRPWPAPDLYGVLRLQGFRDVQIYRQHYRCGERRRLVLPLQKFLCRVMELDHAQGLIAVARK
jgi:SAM-dependent methyltransferase